MTVVFLFLPIILVAIIPGTVMGWISARRIRESDGALYGMGFAAIAALPLPMFAAFFLLLLIPIIVLRASSILGNSGTDGLLVLIPVLATALILLIKLFGTLLKNLKSGEPIVAGFLSRMNRITVILVVLIWFVFGGLFATGLLKTETPPESSMVAEDSVSRSSGFGFQPEHEMTVSSTQARSRTLFLDLDRRDLKEASSAIHSITKVRFNGAVSKPLNTDQKIEEWAARWGSDLMIIQANPKVLTAFCGGPMAYASDLDYDSATPMQVLEAAVDLPQTPPAGEDQPHVTLFGPAVGETIIYRTREGGVGILELRENPEFPKGGVIVRYKTIKRPS